MAANVLIDLQHDCGQGFAPVSRFRCGEVQQLISNIKCTPEPPKLPPYVPSEHILLAIEHAELHREIIKIPAEDMTNELFDFLWSSEHPYPFVVTGIQERLQYPWSPDFFTQLLGDQQCLIQDCETSAVRVGTVREFFSHFGSDSTEREVLRLKVDFDLNHS